LKIAEARKFHQGGGRRRTGDHQVTLFWTDVKEVCVMRLISTFLAVVAIFPATAFSNPLDNHLACEETAHDFVTSLVDARSIKTPAMRVEPNSVNAFRPVSGAGLTAFGLPVHVVFGYQPDDPLFKSGGDKTSSDPVYGVVVLGSAESVKRLLVDAGSTAVVHPVIPLVLTAIVCTQPSSEAVKQ
jgi:hypothetical protein